MCLFLYYWSWGWLEHDGYHLQFFILILPVCLKLWVEGSPLCWKHKLRNSNHQQKKQLASKSRQMWSGSYVTSWIPGLVASRFVFLYPLPSQSGRGLGGGPWAWGRQLPGPAWGEGKVSPCSWLLKLFYFCNFTSAQENSASLKTHSVAEFADRTDRMFSVHLTDGKFSRMWFKKKDGGCFHVQMFTWIILGSSSKN